MAHEANPFDESTEARPDSEREVIVKDTNNSPSSDRTTEELQESSADSPAFDDPDIDESAVKALPGTGGPDDEGDIEVDPADIHL